MPFVSTSLFSVLLILSACTSDRASDVTKQNDTGATVVASGTTLDSPNEKTPETADSLEVQNPDGNDTIETSITQSGAILSGSPDNPHRLTIVSDYDCSYCRLFLTNDLPWIEKDFVAKGTLTIERVFLPMSKAGEAAVRLALCAAEQDKFPQADLWLSTHAIAAIDVKNFAKTVGVNLQKLLQCTAKKNLLDGNLKKAEEAGAKRVPFFMLGSDLWLGLITKEELREKIELAIR